MFTVNGHLLDGEACLVQVLDLALREVTRSFADVASGPPVDGLRGSQLRVLTMVPREGGRRLTELAAIADMSKQAMGEFVADLAGRGMVELAPDPSDRRAKLVSLTPSGRQAADAARRAIAQVDELWSERLGADDVETLKRVAARLAGVDRGELAPG